MKNLLQFLKKNNIKYFPSGKNVITGCVAIKCPMCKDDPSAHCNINKKTGRFFCWRDHTHKGSFKFLSRLLTGSAADLGFSIDDEEFAKLFSNSKTDTGYKTLDIPKGFGELNLGKTPGQFPAYLRERGFVKLNKFLSTYPLYYSTFGSWAWRIIFPMYVDGKLVTWVGRAVGESTLKYKELSLAESVIPPKQCVYNFDNILSIGGRTLVITEGVFDALKMDYYSPEGIRSTCLFTKRLKSDSQLDMLECLSQVFSEIAILFDEDAYYDAMLMFDQLSVLSCNLKLIKLSGVSDPGSMDKPQVMDLCEEHIGTY